MTASPRVAHSVPGELCKLITVIIPDDGTDLALMTALRSDMGVVRASSTACKGLSILVRTKTKVGKLPQPTLARRVEILVPEADAEQVFEFVCQHASIGGLHGGIVMLAPASFCTPYTLPEGVPDEED